MRERLRTTKAGRSAMAQTRTWFEMRTRDNDGIPTDYYLPKEDKDGNTVHSYDFYASQMYCNGAFIAMIDGDTGTSVDTPDSFVLVFQEEQTTSQLILQNQHPATNDFTVQYHQDGV